MAGKTEKQLAVYALIEEYNQENGGPPYNPIKEMIKMGMDLTVGENVRFNAHKEIASYVYPKQRPVDENGKADNDYTIQVINYTQNNIIEAPQTPGQLPPPAPIEIIDGKIVGEVVEVPAYGEEDAD